jgi:hypothetical protein
MDSTGAQGRRFNVTNVFVMLLAVALVMGVLLVFLVLKPAGSGAAFTVSSVTGVKCPKDAGSPACFQAIVSNTGGEAAIVRCQLTPGADTTAEFFSGSPVYTSAAPIEPDRPIPLSIKADVTNGGTTVVAPTVACSPV